MRKAAIANDATAAPTPTPMPAAAPELGPLGKGDDVGDDVECIGATNALVLGLAVCVTNLIIVVVTGLGFCVVVKLVLVIVIELALQVLGSAVSSCVMLQYVLFDSSFRLSLL